MSRLVKRVRWASTLPKVPERTPVKYADIPRRKRQEPRLGWRHNMLYVFPVTGFLLGAWQIKRLFWKLDLIQQMEERMVEEATVWDATTAQTLDIKDALHRRIILHGRYHHDLAMFVGPRIMAAGIVGADVVVPFELKDGSYVLVNRGWVPRHEIPDHASSSTMPWQKADDATKPQLADRRVSDWTTIQTCLRTSQRPNMFTSPNVPEKHRWFYIDVKQMADTVRLALTATAASSSSSWFSTSAGPLQIEDRVVFERWELPGGPTMNHGDIGIGEDAEPLGREFGKIDVKNNHAEYAGVWFSLAGITYTALYISGRRKLASWRARLPLR